MASVEFEQVESEVQKAAAGSLIREYLGWLNDQLERDYGMAFDVEAMVQSDLSDPHKFYPPDGRFYLARLDQTLSGVGSLKTLTPGVGELQRMYVLPEFRGKGIGRAIANKLIDDARSMGLRQLRLESLAFLDAAHSLYRSLGFRRIDRYADNSMEVYQPAEQLDEYYTMTVFMQMDL